MSRPAPALRAAGALAVLELRLTARRGENVLVTLIIPVAVLLFFAGTSVVSFAGDPVRFLLPGSIALGIIAAGLVNLGISTAYERSYGVLKRLGASPLPRWGLVAAKLTAVVILEIVQVILLVAVGILALHWQPGAGWSPLLLAIGVLMGTLAFAGLGLLLAGTLRAEATLAVANGLFLAFLMLGGVLLPVNHLPPFIQPVAALLPSAALADVIRLALDSGPQPASATGSLLLLAAWGAAAAGLAIRRFRWD